jgi:hypothetical protein
MTRFLPCLAALGLAAGASLAREGGHDLFAVDPRLPRLVPAPAASMAAAGPAAGPVLGLSLREEPGDVGGWDLLQALLLPGTDQLQRGQFVKGATMLLVETGVLWLTSDLRRQGDELDGQFKRFADENWSYDRYITYRQHPGEFAGGGDHENEGYLNRHLSEEDWLGVDTQAELDALFQDAAGNDEFVPGGGQGSHGLPGQYLDGYHAGMADAWDHFAVAHTQQYYEMIGKYAQFQRGWSGYGAGAGWEFGASDLVVAREAWAVNRFCPQTEHYMDMRQDSNDKLIAADRLMGVLVANHAASFLDALIQRNRRLGGELGLGATTLPTSSGPVAGLRLRWSL